MKLVLAEKPSVAQSIAKVLGANKRCDGYLEGNGYIVSWCVGHLVELFEPEGYDEKYGLYGFCSIRIGNINHEYCVRHIEVPVTSIFFSLIMVYYLRVP